MRHIKLFETFNSYELPNFRVELVKPGMSGKKWLFSMVDGNGTSWWGVFNYQGLKDLEDSLNTLCIVQELYMEIAWKESASLTSPYGPCDVSKSRIRVNPIPESSKYLILLSDEADMSGIQPGFFPKNTRTVDGISGTYITASGDLKEPNDLWFGIRVEPSNSAFPNFNKDMDKSLYETYPIEINTLWTADHHWSYTRKAENFIGEFFSKDHPIGDRLQYPSKEFDRVTNPWVPITIKDVEPYIISIINAGAPKEFFKILNSLKSRA